MPVQEQLTDNLRRQYARPELWQRIEQALRKAGQDPDNLQRADLAPVDEFHVRGRQASCELAQLVGFTSDMNVIDIGCGIGGAARYIAAEFGCRVTGIDLTHEYCLVAEQLAKRTGLSDLVRYRQGDALQVPYADNSFDVVWTQHMAMNIPQKDALYREFLRLLKPGGTLALYDILAGPVGPLHFPVPWSHGPETNFLSTPGELRQQLESTGFTIITWQDTTEAATAWFRKLNSPGRQPGDHPLGLQLLLGDQFPEMARNQLKNIEEQRTLLYQVTAQKPLQPL